ncbi:carboxypeptidase-like regulatory domain-containing protein [Niabella drilacis]|uniref:CarboxypepD_reg-like domain-containing protein n=1 Tax=Niabella drilacis (strain DSM 25811 / CCM 8410 / CCUG 62505 / LMG 26954 / E90) TaxID=1285928 RepID=A0A1G7AZA1_NIADE|nr:carboxypeptidase-like regulatory domain-containing protein [Niabella drilacis]SDE20113.1 CarboxypepD_reg-like domain-containing protein [Niabella drilacis]
MKTGILLLLFSFFFIKSTGQLFSVTGIVNDSATLAPVSGASVYLPNTTLGTITDTNGRFRIDHLPAGFYELTVTHVAYHPLKFQLSSSFRPDSLYMRPKAGFLNPVVVRSKTKERSGSWKKWGAVFFDIVMGNSIYANSCRIENKEVVVFSYHKKNGILEARTTAPLVIQNAALGYTIYYETDRFLRNEKTAETVSTGTLHFTEMKGDSSKQNTWRRNRAEVYKTSLLRFMRALYNNSLKQQGYSLYRLKSLKIADTVILGNRTAAVTRAMGHIGNTFKTTVDSTEIQAGQITSPVDAQTVALNYPGTLLVRMADSLYSAPLVLDYLRSASFLFFSRLQDAARMPAFKELTNRISSMLYLDESPSLFIKPNGSYRKNSALITNGFFNWSEKVAMMLPLNYYP